LQNLADRLLFDENHLPYHRYGELLVLLVLDSWFATLNHIDSNNNKDDANLIMAKRAGVSIPEYKEYLEGTKIFSVEDNIETFKAGKDKSYLPTAAVEASKFLFENGFTKTKVDTSKMFDDRFVKAYLAKVRGK
jgi:NitT/TauT family transport system substrate-binding protein